MHDVGSIFTPQQCTYFTFLSNVFITCIDLLKESKECVKTCVLKSVVNFWEPVLSYYMWVKGKEFGSLDLATSTLTSTYLVNIGGILHEQFMI